jgi:hypothetical protein
MTTTLTYTLGKFVWRELLTRDLEGAKRFYGELFGWRIQDVPFGEGGTYTLLYSGETQVGGMMDLAHVSGGANVPPHWGVYVSVADVDAAAAKVAPAGGKVFVPPTDIPEVGRFAVIQDPQGAVFSLFRSAKGDMPDAEPAVGEFCWEHLHTTDPTAALPFYTEVVGWGVQEMMGLHFFNRNHGQTPLAVVSQTPEGVPAHWLTYVRVADLDATVAKTRELGGEAIEPRIDVPGMGAFALLKDPAGAYFMLSQPA